MVMLSTFIANLIVIVTAHWITIPVSFYSFPSLGFYRRQCLRVSNEACHIRCRCTRRATDKKKMGEIIQQFVCDWSSWYVYGTEMDAKRGETAKRVRWLFYEWLRNGLWSRHNYGLFLLHNNDDVNSRRKQHNVDPWRLSVAFISHHTHTRQKGFNGAFDEFLCDAFMRCHMIIKIKKVYWPNLFAIVCHRLRRNRHRCWCCCSLNGIRLQSRLSQSKIFECSSGCART